MKDSLTFSGPGVHSFILGCGTKNNSLIRTVHICFLFEQCWILVFNTNASNSVQNMVDDPFLISSHSGDIGYSFFDELDDE